jgi:hypothetical protein
MFYIFIELTTTRIAGGLDFPPKAEKTQTRQCSNSYLWHRVHSTRFETKNQTDTCNGGDKYFWR